MIFLSDLIDSILENYELEILTFVCVSNWRQKKSINWFNKNSLNRSLFIFVGRYIQCYTHKHTHARKLNWWISAGQNIIMQLKLAFNCSNENVAFNVFVSFVVFYLDLQCCCLPQKYYLNLNLTFCWRYGTVSMSPDHDHYNHLLPLA